MNGPVGSPGAYGVKLPRKTPIDYEKFYNDRRRKGTDFNPKSTSNAF